MVVIDAIRTTQKGRYALFADGEFLFSIDEQTMADSGLCKGSSLTNEELLLLERKSETRKAEQAAMNLLGRRAHGKAELRRKLAQRFDNESCCAAVDKMCELGFMSDEDFARQKAQEMHQKGKSALQISQALQALGIERDIVEEVAAPLGQDDEQTALRLIQKQYAQKLADGQREKVMAALARRGFTHRQIVAALRLAEEELGPF